MKSTLGQVEKLRIVLILNGTLLPTHSNFRSDWKVEIKKAGECHDENGGHAV